MNKLTILVHTPSGVGEATLTCDAILNSKHLTHSQKQMLLNKFTDSVVYNKDTYYKIAEAEKVEVTKSELFYNPFKNAYLEVSNKKTSAYVDDIYEYNAVLKNNTEITLW